MTVGLPRLLNPRLGPFETQVDQSGGPTWKNVPLVPPWEDGPGSSEPGVARVSRSVHVLSVVEMGLCRTGPGDRTSLLLVSAVWWRPDGARVWAGLTV